MQFPTLTHLHAHRERAGQSDPDGPTLVVRLQHGRANEMGIAQLHDWEAICAFLEDGPCTSLITWSDHRSSKGTPIFISGADVTERVGWQHSQVRAHVRWQRHVLARLRRVPAFHTAVVTGVALGWGTEFLVACDYRIACPEALFALPETGIGILPGAGGTSELWAMIGAPQALRLGMTGERIDGDEAARIGLVQEVAESVEAGLARARALSTMVARRSPTAIAAFKRALLASIGTPFDKRTHLESRAYELCLISGDAEIGRRSFKEITRGGEVAWGPRMQEDG